jgi:hypothetical protein
MAATREPSFELYVETGSVSRIQNSWPEGIDLQTGPWPFAPAHKMKTKIKRKIAVLNEIFIGGWRSILRVRIIRMPVSSGRAFRTAGELYTTGRNFPHLISQRRFFTPGNETACT